MLTIRMFFVLSINTRNQTAKIVGHATDLEAAIEEVRKCSRDYVLRKSEHILHRVDQLSDSPRVNFYTQNSQENIHHIEVFRQRTQQVRYWGIVSADQSQPAELIRRFMYTQYSGAHPSTTPIAPPPPAISVVQTTNPVAKRTVKAIPTGSFPLDVIEDLMKSQQFQNHRTTTDQNSKPHDGITPNRIVFGTSSASDDDSL